MAEDSGNKSALERAKAALASLGFVLVQEYRGETWNDGGHWEQAVFQSVETREFYIVRMPSDYRPDEIEFFKARRNVEVTFTSTEKINAFDDVRKMADR